MVRFMAKLAKLESKSPVRTLLLAAGDGLGPPAWKPAAPTEPPDGWRRSPNASNPLVDPLAEGPKADANELSEAKWPPPKPFCDEPAGAQEPGRGGMTGAAEFVGDAKGFAASWSRSSDARLCAPPVVW